MHALVKKDQKKSRSAKTTTTRKKSKIDDKYKYTRAHHTVRQPTPLKNDIFSSKYAHTNLLKRTYTHKRMHYK